MSPPTPTRSFSGASTVVQDLALLAPPPGLRLNVLEEFDLTSAFSASQQSDTIHQNRKNLHLVCHRLKADFMPIFFRNTMVS
jgi:hypothetical protein